MKSLNGYPTAIQRLSNGYPTDLLLLLKLVRSCCPAGGREKRVEQTLRFIPLLLLEDVEVVEVVKVVEVIEVIGVSEVINVVKFR